MKEKKTHNYSFNIPQPGLAPSIEQMLNTAINLHQRKNFRQAEDLYRQVLQRQPKHAYALNLLGVLVSQHRGDHAETEKLITKAIRIDPDVPDYHNNLGLALQQQGKMKEAARAFEKATRLNPAFTTAWFGLGNVSVYLNNAETAIKSYQKVIEIDPDFLPAWNNLGNVYRELRRFDDAMDMFNRVIELKPDFAEGWYNIGALYKVKGEGGNAIAAFDRAITLKPDYVKAYNNRGDCRRKLSDDTEGALKDFDAALAINPRSLMSYVYRSNVFQALGRFEEAENELRKALDIDESALSAYVGLVSGKTYNEQDLAKLQVVLEESDLDTKQLVEIHFALGKIFDDRKDYEKAFRHFQRGNELHRNTYPYDSSGVEQFITFLIENFDETYIIRNRSHGLDSEVPIFIVGMPRSGTTLAEQIIGSHPEVYAAGELQFIGRSAEDLEKQQMLSQLSPDVIKNMAGDYLSNIRKLDPTARRITDKMPGNFIYAGLIAILFPEARIIHCKRNPLDTCLSIFTQKFGEYHLYAYDLTELGLYYRQYLRLMAHWEHALQGHMLTIHYEDLLRDQEGMSRKLINYVGLDWDKRCLQFHEAERSVKTASVWQVRQKLYTTSKERWRNYEPWLTPLMTALGDAVVTDQ